VCLLQNADYRLTLFPLPRTLNYTQYWMVSPAFRAVALRQNLTHPPPPSPSFAGARRCVAYLSLCCLLHAPAPYTLR